MNEKLVRELRGKYRIVTELGSGGSADIWLALAQGPNGFNKLVVLKTLRSELLSDTHLVRLFLEEARLAARLNHPNIVQTNEVFVREGRPVIVMEYLDGVAMSELLERQRHMRALSQGMLLRIVSEALSGLHAAHELTDFDGSSLSVVHRDVSPHNLFVTFAGQVKVLDFGIAKFSASGEVTETGIIKGKLRYMPPEQINAEPVDRRGDIYSMGVILWETATSRRMWPDLNEGTIMKRILSGEVPPPSSVNPQVDARLERIIERALRLDPNDRYSSALDMQSELDDFALSLGTPVRNRSIGRDLSGMFQDLRVERARSIDHRVAQATESVPPEETPFSVAHPSKQPKSPSPDESSHVSWVAAFFVGVTIFGALLVWRQSESLATSPPFEKELSAQPVKAPASQAETFQIRITAFPGEASLQLDGQELKSNPYASRVSPNERSHTLVVSAEGYQSQTRTLRFNQDQEIVISLKKPNKVVPDLGPPPNAKTRNIPRPVKHPASPTPTRSMPDRCDPPHFFDDRGIKKFKPECL